MSKRLHVECEWNEIKLNSTNEEKAKSSICLMKFSFVTEIHMKKKIIFKG